MGRMRTASRFRTLTLLGALPLTCMLAACGGSDDGREIETAVETSAPAVAAALPAGDHIAFALSEIRVAESQRHLPLRVLRSGSGTGESIVRWRVQDVDASQGLDYRLEEGLLRWSAGDTSERIIDVLIESDLLNEGIERFTVSLEPVSGSDLLSARPRVEVQIDDAACRPVDATHLNSDSQWSEACYQLTQDLVVADGVQWQINPGTTVLADPGVVVKLQGSANLYSVGETRLPVQFRGSESGAGSWGGLRLSGQSALHRLSHTEISDAVYAVDAVEGNSFILLDDNRFSHSEGALRVPLALGELIGTGNIFDTVHDGVELHGTRVSEGSSVRLPSLGTHYTLRNGMVLTGRLDIDPGAELRFDSGSQIYVGASGILSAIGTADKPVLLRGVGTAQGAWYGVQFAASSSAENRLEHVEILHGGGNPTFPGNVSISGSTTRLNIVNALLSESFGYGLYVYGQLAELNLNSVSYSNNRSGERN